MYDAVQNHTKTEKGFLNLWKFHKAVFQTKQAFWTSMTDFVLIGMLVIWFIGFPRKTNFPRISIRFKNSLSTFPRLTYLFLHGQRYFQSILFRVFCPVTRKYSLEYLVSFFPLTFHFSLPLASNLILDERKIVWWKILRYSHIIFNIKLKMWVISKNSF